MRGFIDEEGIATVSAFSFQSSAVNGSGFYTPQPDRLSGYCDASLG
ncbi:MAG: hypothetical protein P8P91_12425 [Pseudomonadales bacterium]|nr:hypothetical protein [Pseudomonadales bacterium]